MTALLWLAHCLPLRITSRWRWYRRACGGRWAQRLATVRWHRVPRCPAADGLLVFIGSVTPQEYEAHRACCTCEVWP